MNTQLLRCFRFALLHIQKCSELQLQAQLEPGDWKCLIHFTYLSRGVRASYKARLWYDLFQKTNLKWSKISFIICLCLQAIRSCMEQKKSRSTVLEAVAGFSTSSKLCISGKLSNWLLLSTEKGRAKFFSEKNVSLGMVFDDQRKLHNKQEDLPPHNSWLCQRSGTRATSSALANALELRWNYEVNLGGHEITNINFVLLCSLYSHCTACIAI